MKLKVLELFSGTGHISNTFRARGYRAEFGVGFESCKQIIDEYLRR
nr:MAG TPA: DNA cytosine methyltransferase [Caudoviricetes sp.]